VVAHLLAPQPGKYTFPLRGGVLLVVQAQPSRARARCMDDVTRCPPSPRHVRRREHARVLVRERALEPFPVIADGLERFSRATSPPSAEPRGAEAMRSRRLQSHAQAVQDRFSPSARRMMPRRASRNGAKMASLADQRVEEERRLIAHELHDEFGQSVTVDPQLALAIASQGGMRDPRPATSRD